MKHLYLTLVAVLLTCGLVRGQQVPMAKSIEMRIMIGLFSNYNPQKHQSMFMCDDTATLHKFQGAKGRTPFVAHLLYLDSSQNAGNKCLYALVGLKPIAANYNAHVYGQVIQFYCFAKSGALWYLKYHALTNQMGSFGDAPRFEVMNIGNNNTGFLFKPGFTGQGYKSCSFVLYSFNDGKFKQVWSVDDAENDNTGTLDAVKYAYTAKVQFVDNRSAYNDIILRKMGTIIQKGKLVGIDSIIDYRFLGDEYRRIK